MIELPASDIPHTEDGLAACADPSYLKIVDKAYARPGGSEAQWMKKNLCRRCPIVDACYAHAMRRHEDGIWGASAPNTRTRRGASR